MGSATFCEFPKLKSRPVRKMSRRDVGAPYVSTPRLKHKQ
jgi:hypothetical protein